MKASTRRNAFSLRAGDYRRLFADCVFVRGAATFTEILEAELNCTPAPHGAGAWNRPMTTPLFVFERTRPGPVAYVHTLASGNHKTPFTQPPVTKKRTMSVREMRALAALNDMGAELGETLSASLLRRAFRRLARRYHPDRHPGSSAAEQQRLARVFGEANEHYRVLMSALAAHVGPT